MWFAYLKGSTIISSAHENALLIFFLEPLIFSTHYDLFSAIHYREDSLGYSCAIMTGISYSSVFCTDNAMNKSLEDKTLCAQYQLARDLYIIRTVSFYSIFSICWFNCGVEAVCREQVAVGGCV